MILFKKIKILSETKSLRLKSILKIKVYIASLRWKILILPKNTKMRPTKKLKLEELGRIDVETFKKTDKISSEIPSTSLPKTKAYFLVISMLKTVIITELEDCQIPIPT